MTLHTATLPRHAPSRGGGDGTGGGGRVARTLLALSLGLAGATGAWAQARYAVTDLGMLPGYATCVTTKLNDQGSVVGYCAPAVENFNQMGFVWNGGTMTAVGKLTGGLYSIANAVNATGKVTGDGDNGNGRPQSWVSSPTGLVNIFSNNGGNTHSLFIGDTGWVGGYYTKSLSGNTSSWKGAIWTPSAKDPRKYSTLDLPVLPGGIDPKSTSSIPSAFNQSGQAAGYASNDQIGQHAAFWNNNAAHSIVDLGVYPGDWSSLAWGLNDLGQVVGTSHPPFGSRPVLWNNDPAHTAVALPPLPGDNAGQAFAINNLGQVLGTSNLTVPGTWDGATPERLVIWRDGGVFTLQSLLDPVSGAGWTVVAAAAINNVGQIAATATFNGQTRPVLLTPMP
ncbi:hypothetical protein [Ideonella sp. A 288]|uniref:hypothetical protein n=1 Tax=Ideonella sp. A 288 TaxID=1962181 RepID=UPI000B4A9EC7|nr:hypothetical protein [Ideonella sp. A 288]